MANIETWFEQDLMNPVTVRNLGSIFSQDSLGNLIGVRVKKNGDDFTLSGSVNGYCILADGSTVPVIGTRSGSEASIILPASAYSVTGPIAIAIKLTDGSAITTLCACVGIVTRSRTGVQIDPGQTVTDWTNQIAAALQEVIDTSAAQDVKIDDLKSALNDVNDIFADELGVKNYIFTYGAWVTTTTTTVDPTNLDSNANRVYCIIDCQPGDEFDVKLGGVNSSHRPYSFIDLNNGVLEQATSNGKTGTITAPENAVKLVLNSGTGIDYYCVKNNSRLTSIESRIDAIDEEIERQDVIVEEITETVNLVDQSELLNATGWAENNGDFFGTLANLNAQFGNDTNGIPSNIEYKTNTQYTFAFDSKIDNPWTEGNGLVVTAFYSDDTNTRIPIAQSAEWSHTKLTTTSGKTVVKFALSYAASSDKTVHMRELMLNEGEAIPYIPYKVSAIDEIARKKIDSVRDLLRLESTNDYTDRTNEIKEILEKNQVCCLGAGKFAVKGLTLAKGQSLEGIGKATEVILSGSVTENLFSYSRLAAVWYDDGGVYRGTADAINQFELLTSYASSTRYAVQITARELTPNVSGNGLRVILKYTDADAANVIVFSRSDLNWNTKYFTTETNRTVESIKFAYVSGKNDNWEINEITVYNPDSATAEAGTAVIMLDDSSISNLSLKGSFIPLTEEDLATEGNRIGISIPVQSHRVSVTNCFISDFNGNGIYAVNNSTSDGAFGHVIGCYVFRNHVGINFYDRYEYSKVSDCTIEYNYIGVMNNGGNNLFSNCGFNNNYNTGFVADNSEDNHSNNTHGSCVGCNFNHNGHNTGIAIGMYGTLSGFTFTGCNVFYGHININQSKRIIFDGCNFGSALVLDINSGTTLFIGCLFRDDTVSNITDALNRVKFVNCYNADGSVFDPLAT